MTTKPRSLGDILQEFSQHRQLMQEELQKIIIGQSEVIEQMFAAIFTRGHCLLEGVPGLAKTLMVSTLARILDIGFKRIQFTPDLMPSDITGTNVLDEDDTGRRNFRFVEGPIFTNILLADEINRTPPKTQAALLQAMQEREVSVGQTTYTLPDPFFTIATQNPIEQEGTYPLPEAQLDRFMFNIKVDYPTAAEEEQILGSDHAQRKARGAQGAFRPRDRQFAKAGGLGGGERIHRQVRGSLGAGDAAERRIGSAVRARAGRLGRRAACRPVLDPRRQGAGGDGRPFLRRHRRCAKDRHARAAPPHQHQFSGPGRRHDERRRDPASAEGNPHAGNPEIREVRPEMTATGERLMPNRLLKLQIEGFRSLSPSGLGAGDLNVLIGPNAGGKSNLLKAIELLAVSASGNLGNYIKQRGGMEPLVWDGKPMGVVKIIANLELETNDGPTQFEYRLHLARLKQTSSFEIEEESLWRPMEGALHGRIVDCFIEVRKVRPLPRVISKDRFPS